MTAPKQEVLAWLTEATDTTQMAVGLEQHQTRKAIPTVLDALLDSDDDDSSDDDW